MAISRSTAAASETSQVLDVVRDIHQRNSDFEGKLDSIESRLIRTVRSLDFYCASISLTVVLQETSIVQHQTPPIMTPGLLRMFLDSQRELDEDIKRSALNMSPDLRVTGCRCTYLHNHDAVPTARQTRHSGRNWCRCHTSDKRLASLCAQHTFCNWLLRCCVTVSLEITHGAGGLSISPGLRFRAVVPANSPTFALLSNNSHVLWEMWARKESAKVNDALQDTAKGLLEMFRDGSACPTDALPNGDTILHVRRIPIHTPRLREYPSHCTMRPNKYEGCSTLARTNQVLEPRFKHSVAQTDQDPCRQRGGPKHRKQQW